MRKKIEYEHRAILVQPLPYNCPKDSKINCVDDNGNFINVNLYCYSRPKKERQKLMNKEQRIANYTGNNINDWIEENNKNGWYIKEILQYKQFIDTKRYDCIFLIEKED